MRNASHMKKFIEPDAELKPAGSHHQNSQVPSIDKTADFESTVAASPAKSLVDGPHSSRRRGTPKWMQDYVV